MALQVPIGPDPQPDERHEGESCFSVDQPALVQSLESQLKLRALYEYVEDSRNALNDIKMHLSMLESNPGCSACLKTASQRLGDFCIEADSWGFDSLYETSLGLQTLLLDSSGHVEGEDFWKALNRGLTVLSVLLDQCEGDFRQRLAISDLLDGTEKAACH
jgi:hypothetical protein